MSYSHQVCIGVRVVPAGVLSLSAGKRYFRATLIFSPVQADKTNLFGSTIDIAEWPAKIEELLNVPGNPALANVKIQMSTSKPDDSTPAVATILTAYRAVIVEQHAKQPSFESIWRDKRPTDMKQISDWWAKLMNPSADPGEWKNLSDALSSDDLLSRATDNGVPNVESGGNAKAALVIVLERARSLIERIKSCEPNTEDPVKQKHGSLRKIESNLAYVPPDPFDRTRPWPEWAGERPKVMALAEAAGTEAHAGRGRSGRKDFWKGDKLIRLAKAYAGLVVTRDPLELKRHYEVILACAEQNTDTSDCFAAATAQNTHQLSAQVDAVVDRHAKATGESKPREADTAPQPIRTAEQQAIVHRLVALQSQPVLARLFNLNVDILIAVDSSPTSWWGSLPRSAAAAGSFAKFAFLSAAFDGLGAQRRNWTTTKIVLNDNKVADAFPCTLFELMTPDALPSLTQYDGALALNGSYGFDITSLDVTQALENRRTHCSGNGGGDNADAQRLLTLRTAGLSLLSLNQCNTAFGQLSRSGANSGAKTTILEAEDLTVGYRLDIATDTHGGLAWRTLCRRDVHFGKSSDSKTEITNAAIEDVLKRVVPDPAKIAVYNSARISPPGRFAVDPAEGDRLKIYAEEIVAQWLGPPLGVDTEGRSTDINECQVKEGALALSQTVSLLPENIGKNGAIAPLRFGHAYRFGMTAKYTGGYSRDLNDFRGYEGKFAKFAVLPAPGHQARRFLRHERVEAPIVTTPRFILDRVFDNVIDGTRESAYHAIVRSQALVNGEAVKDEMHAVSRRVVFPPSVSATFAERHGKFPKDIPLAEFKTLDKIEKSGKRNYRSWKGPRDGIQTVNYDSPIAGGFPTRSPTTPAPDRSDTGGDAIFSLRSKSAGKHPRLDPYYPDPAASYLVIALRDRADRLLIGAPLVVPFQHDNVHYPDIAPVLIETIADPSLTGTTCNQGRIRLMTGVDATKPTTYYLDDHGEPSILNPTKDRVAASWVQIRLAPGDDVYCDIWAIPSESELLRWFDIVETAATLLTQSTPGADKSCPSCDTIIGANQLLEEVDLDVFQKWRADNDVQICATANKEIRIGVIRCVAGKTDQLLRTVGVMEVAARARIEMIHATPKPVSKPSGQVELFRVDSDKWNETLQPRDHDDALYGPPAGDPVAGSTSVLIGGAVSVDSPSGGIITVEATGPSLATSAFDDHQNRRRSSDEVFRGLWPNDPLTGQPKTPFQVYGFGVKPDGSIELPSQKVTLLRVVDTLQPVTWKLRRWERDLIDLQRRSAKAEKENKEVVEKNKNAHNDFDRKMRDWDKAMLDYMKKIKDNPGQDPGEAPLPPSPPPSPNSSPGTSTLLAPHASYPFQIKDTFARVLKVESTSASRTAIHFRNELADVIEDEKTIVRSDPQRIAIPSTKAPARVAPLTILPAFALRYGCEQARAGGEQVYTVKREVRLRVRMQRPWFSSGAGERLGVVLWPPEIASSGPLGGRIDDSHNLVSRDYDISRLPFFGEKPDIAMQAFSDADLGPGGAFVTRWGADPVKKDPTNVGWLMPPEAFADLRNAAVFGHSNLFAGSAWKPESESADEQEYVYVPRVDMPVPDDATSPEDMANNKKEKPPRTIGVALLTYKPRFDVDPETWFADVAIDAGGMHEPFIRLGLVRFQANAPAALRVSEPVTEWVQVLPKREAHVSVDKNDPRCIHVTVKGRGHLGSENHEGLDPLRLDGWRQRPLMRVSVLRTDANGFETTALLSDAPEEYEQDAARTWIPKTLSQWINWLRLDEPKKPNGPGEVAPRPHCALHPETKNGELIWRATFNLSEEVVSPAPAAPKFAVFLEEVEAMRPSTLPGEPVDPSDTREDWLEISGPRFAARIPIELNDCEWPLVQRF